jgi:hypothetical protein
VYIYSGSSRSNLTTLIEINSKAVRGAPYVVKIDDGAVIIAQAVIQSANG